MAGTVTGDRPERPESCRCRAFTSDRQYGGVQTPKLVASDVDGTLLDPMEGVTARTAAAVARTLAAGTPFVLASGRPPRGLPAEAQAAGVSGYAVCANGAVLYDIGTDRVLEAHTLPAELLGDLAHALYAAMPE